MMMYGDAGDRGKPHIMRGMSTPSRCTILYCNDALRADLSPCPSSARNLRRLHCAVVAGVCLAVGLQPWDVAAGVIIAQVRGLPFKSLWCVCMCGWGLASWGV